MSGHLTIALDAMGGDLGPDAVIPGAALALQKKKNLRFMIFGDTKKIEPLLAQYPKLAKVSEIHHTDHAVSPHDKAGVALRTGRHSSMRLAINAVSDKQAHCVISGGNTGALMAMAKMVLKCLPGIERPAIASILPTVDKEVVMLDLGANLECTTDMLVQFAIMGSVYARVVRGHEQPTVGLLNIGSEDAKGHEEIREAASILQELKFPGRYTGFVEGNDIPMGTVDVVVTDGFTGNVALKTAEGVSKFITTVLKRKLKKSPIAMIGALLASRALKELKSEMDPRHYNGGMFLGLDGVCVKSHGGMDHIGFCNAILYGAEVADKNFNVRVASELSDIMAQEQEIKSHLVTPEPELQEMVS